MTNCLDKLLFVTCLSRVDTARDNLLASPCLGPRGHPAVLHWNCTSAAQALNAVLDSNPYQTWVVWVHEDVFLPDGWDVQFLTRLDEAEERFGPLAVAGVYGVAGAGSGPRRAGNVVDRGRLLQETEPLPCLVDSLDELLFAVRADTTLRLDSALGFDFYGTDLVLQAQAAGFRCAVVDARCEHRSSTPASGAASEILARRIARSGTIFEKKWQHRLPLTTSCFDIRQPGDVAAIAKAWTAH